MTAISRRAALRGAAAVAARGAVTLVAVAVPAISSVNAGNADADLLTRVAQWHRAYLKFKEADLFSEEHPTDTVGYYGLGHGNDTKDFWAALRVLSEARPKTLVGAVALLGCAERVAADCERRRAGERMPQIVFFVHTDRLRKNAYLALERLVGEGLS